MVQQSADRVNDVLAGRRDGWSIALFLATVASGANVTLDTRASC
jgi:hypothetical protein